MDDFDDRPYPRIASDGKVDLGIDNPEYNDYLRAGVPGYLIPWNYEEQARQSKRSSVYPHHEETPWWLWILLILFILSMCAIAFGPMLIM